ncbi:MAG: 16S rRNA (cytosine(1402)-N(4))-methyltransferase RsmH [Lentisphaerota bacterium]
MRMYLMHLPVLLHETLELMGIRKDGVYIDGTFGGGGHAAAILNKLGAEGRLLGIDRDPDALKRLAASFEKWGSTCCLAHGDFADMIAIAQRRGVQSVDGVLLDLGMSSDQVDDPVRGFSFMKDGPLDMRMDPTQSRSALDVIRESDEQSLAGLIRTLGEEPKARTIARHIVRERERAPIETTTRLAAIVEAAAGGRRGRIHPATKTFQALRMAVNHELESIEQGLQGALRLLSPGGRLAVISFHSLEDRLVKRFMAGHVGRWESLQAGGCRWMGELPPVRWITKKPVMASEEEIRRNPRSRSAKLRVAERVTEPC